MPLHIIILMEMNLNTTIGDLAALHTGKTGSGSPVLLVHNFDVCSSMHEWNNIEAELAKTNTVYSIDLLGCGCSERPILTYTNFLYVQLINDFN